MGNPIVFSPSDIDTSQPAVPVQQQAPAASNGPITFSPSDIDHSAPAAAKTKPASTAPIQTNGPIPGAPNGLPGVPNANAIDDQTNPNVPIDPFTGQKINSQAEDLDPNEAGNVVKGAAKQAVSSIWHALPPVQLADETKSVLPVINAYEKARSNGASIPDAIQAADTQARQQNNVVQDMQQKLKTFLAHPNREAADLVAQAAILTAATYGGGAVLGGGAEAADAAEAAEPGAAEVAPETESTPEVPESTPETQTPSLIDKGKNLYQQVTKGEQVAQAPAQQALRQGAQAAAEDAGVGPTIGPDQGIRTLMERPIAEQAATEGKLYDTLNDAAETDMKSLYDRQEELQDALEDPTQVANKSALQEELKTTQANIAKGEANVQAKLGGDASKLVADAKAATQQRYAMENFDQKMLNNESVVSGNVEHGTPETINVKAAIRQAENLDKPSKFAPRGTPSRLQQALGEDGAKAFKQALYDAQKAGEEAVTKQELAAKYLSRAKTTAKVVGFTGAGALALYEWLNH